MSPLLFLAAADAGPVGEIAKTFGANVPALIANAISFVLVALMVVFLMLFFTGLWVWSLLI